MTEMRDITTYSVIQRFHDAVSVVKPFSLRGSVIRQISCNFFPLAGLAMHIGKTAEKEYTVSNCVQLCKVEAVTKNVYICGDVYTWVAKHERSYMIAYEKAY